MYELRINNIPIATFEAVTRAANFASQYIIENGLRDVAVEIRKVK